LLSVSIAFLAYLSNKANLSCFIIGVGLLFHIPTAFPAAALVLLTEVVNNKITRKIFHHIFLIFIPITFFYFHNFEKLDNEFYLFTAKQIWFAEVENRIPYLFIRNFDIEQIIIMFGWFILIPIIILKSFTKERYKNLSYILFLPITYLIIGQISIDLFKFPIAMILQSSKFTNIFIIPLSLLLLICLDKKPITNFGWILLLLSLIYRNEFLPFIVLFIIYIDINYKLSSKMLSKLVILILTFLSSFSINIKYYNSDFLTYVLTGWMHPHYGLRIEPVIWRSKFFLGNLDMWQSPSYSNDRLNLLTYIKKNTKINELTLISDTVADDFHDFRSRTNRGLYWDKKSGGAIYYNGDNFVNKWSYRRKVNFLFSQSFELNKCKKINHEFIQNLKDNNVVWYLTDKRIICSNNNLLLNNKFSFYYLYKVTY
jgi:hypothetical protein